MKTLVRCWENFENFFYFDVCTDDGLKTGSGKRMQKAQFWWSFSIFFFLRQRKSKIC